MPKKALLIICIFIIVFIAIFNFKGFGNSGFGFSNEVIISESSQLGFNYPYDNNYAGTWYEDGVLKSGTTELFAKWLQSENMVTQKFSFNELIKLYVFIYSIRDDYSIVSIGLSQKENKINIMVENAFDIFKIHTRILISSGFNTALVLRGVKYELGTISEL